MALPTINIPNFAGASTAVPVANSGRNAAADSSAVVLSNEDLTALTASRPVTGIFWQATQPVSIATMPSTPVTGTFWQATQPISGAVTANAGTGTFAVSAASLPLPTGAATSANQTALNALFPATIGQKAKAASLSVALATDDPLVTVGGATTDAAVANGAAGTLAGYLRSIKDAATDTTTPSPVTAPTLTKGTQGANGWSVQQLKDAGRSALCMTAQFTFAQTAETLLTLTLSADGAATTTFSSRVITSGKRFRIQAISATIESLGSGTAPQRAYLRLRRNTAGATTATSALQAVWGFVNATAVVKSGFSMDYEVPDGLEMTGDGTGTFGFTLETPDWVTTTATGQIKLTVIGIEF